jgi:hypothetical protein
VLVNRISQSTLHLLAARLHIIQVDVK